MTRHDQLITEAVERITAAVVAESEASAEHIAAGTSLPASLYQRRIVSRLLWSLAAQFDMITETIDPQI